jgi:hypothetical protein
MSITVKFIERDDWQQLQVNGETVLENHRLRLKDIAAEMKDIFGVEIGYEYIEEREDEDEVGTLE